MHFTVPVFERKTLRGFECTTLGLGPLTCERAGLNQQRVHKKMLEHLRPAFEKAPAIELARVEMPRGIRLEKVRLELHLGGADRRKVTGLFPVVVEPRWASDDARITLAYHPARQDEAAPIREDLPLAEQVRALFQKTWAELSEHEIEELHCRGKERITAIGFSCSPRSALEDLPRRRDDDGGDPAWQRRRKRGLKVLPELGVNLTARAAQGDLDAGVPRPPYREQLALLLAASRAQPVIVVGPPGCGKTTLIHQAARDLLDADGYATHRNLDRVRQVWQLSGRRIIAGMSRLGEWEKRCVDLLEDAYGRDLILVVDDLHHFARIGQSRESDRSLADFFRGPLLRRELTLVGECTPEALRHLEQEAPSFAALFTQLHLPEATRPEALRLMLRESRALEQRHPITVSPHALRAILDVGGALLSSRALPGKAMDLLRELATAPAPPDAERSTRSGDSPARRSVGAPEVLRLLSGKTGVPEPLIRRDAPVDPDRIEQDLARQVIGQPAAVRAAADLVARVKAGLTDPRRPYGVYLFTGPTGTGKTELAKCLAELLYGSPSRLLRFDMSELSGPDAPARLIGDRWDPDGLLTQRAQEQPFSLILLDEIEKAHRSVHALLLQLFEDGRLTDAAGRTARFNHAVIVMTSNLGARVRSPVGFGEGGSAARTAAAAEERMKEIAAAVRDFFPPELFNRIDRIVPFRPLTPEVAALVTDKELGKLLRRRGLAERSIFVTASAGVSEKLAEIAFSAQDGARSVKRAIEDRIGGLLSDAIAGATPAAMQILRIRTHGDDFALDREVLSEAPPAPARWAIEPLLDRPLPALVGELAVLSERTAALAQSHELARLSERIRHHLREHAAAGSAAFEHAEAVYNLDAMRAAVAAFRDQVDAYRRRIEGDPEAEHQAIEVQRFGTREKVGYDSVSTIRLFLRSQLERLERAPTRPEVLAAIAEGHAMQRALRKVDEPGQHAILIELLRAGALDEERRFAAPSADGLLESLARAYTTTGRGDLESWAALRPDGELLRGGPGDPLRGDAELLVLGVVGLCVRDFYELEAGTHVWNSLGRGPELVRVRVLPVGPGQTPVTAVEEHRRRKEAFDDATRRGGPLPESPTALLPVVRTIRFDPPRQPGRTAPIEIEDYAMGYADTAEVRSLAQALEPLWLLRMSREDVE